MSGRFCCDARPCLLYLIRDYCPWGKPMRRREFIALLGSAPTWPLAAHAQQAGKLPTVGFLGVATPTAWGPWASAFVQRLHELGWIEGRTIAIEYRWAEGRSERFAEIAA